MEPKRYSFQLTSVTSLCWALGEAGEAPDPPDDDLEEGEDLSDGDPDPELDISLPHEPELLMWTL